ncbi:lipopolysaccharide biosynthesis protein [Pseudoalteromonas fuliginea]|uniref:Polysaccharide biosynthesis protein n=1 Tax=Pseudoalteromonas fuliginea TaxID=1872678 RepID=A0ABQ6RNA0_9GAMM|nr:oligosaccharide flippase family protein [Pseudoalteromonas fuliginea]KAA1166117.1 hypothetical protein EU509_00690 [Pseudoalteromonas fuliginea]KAA1169759.1 hypothetical protein EUZ79_00800 [Pseudoalteromonas fuliginea]
MKNILIYLLSNISNGLLPLALLPLFTKYLSPIEYGFVALFQMFFVFFRSMSGISYVTACERNYFSKGFCNTTYVNASFNLIIATSFILFIFVYLFSESISKATELNSRYIFQAIASGAFAVIVQLRLSQWQVEKNALRYGFLQLLLGLMNNLLAIALVVYLDMGVEGRVDSIFYTYMVFCLICYFSLYKENKINLSIGSNNVYKEIICFSLPLLPHLFGVLLLTVFDRFVLKMNLGLEMVGIYMVGFQLMASVGILSDAFNKFFSPIQMELLANESLDSSKLLVKYIYMWMVFISVCGLFSIMLLDFFTKYFLDEEYVKVTDIIPWLALGQIFNGIYITLLNVIYFSKKTASLSISTLIVSCIHIVVFYVMTNLYGLEGAGIAFSISMAIRLIFTFILSNMVLPLPWLLRKSELSG